MAILVLATSGAEGEVALAATARGPVVVRALGAGAERGRQVLAVARSLLESEGLVPRDLEDVVVDVGPGSFTGVRVGTTAAKTLAWALGARLTGVVSLAALAAAAPPDREIVAVRDAGRGRLYVARYGPGAAGARPCRTPPARRPAAEALSALGGSLLVGENAPALAAAHGLEVEVLGVGVGAATVLAAAAAALEREGAGPAAHTLVPLYLQDSAPQRRRAGEVDPDPAERGGNDRPRE